MTDNEIIVPLKCLVMNESDCRHCKLKDKNDKCQKFLYSDVLGLIDENNRQKAKIKALQMDNKQLETDNFNANMNCEHLQAEIGKLKYQVNRLKEYDEKRDIALHSRLIATSRDEAVKEFAERLCADRVSNDPVVIAVKVELKEMVGADGGS